MRKLFLSIVAVLFFSASSLFFVSCDNNGTKNEQTEQHEHSDMNVHAKEKGAYACPMHSEVTGKKGDKCSKCGMKLTVVPEDEHAGHDHE